MKTLLILLCLFPLSVFANWDIEVALGVDGETWKIEHAKFAEGKETKLQLGNYIVKMTFKKNTEEPKYINVNYTVEEKKGEKLTLINKGFDSIEEKTSSELYAKGEPGQPHSIITFKMKK